MSETLTVRYSSASIINPAKMTKCLILWSTPTCRCSPSPSRLHQLLTGTAHPLIYYARHTLMLVPSFFVTPSSLVQAAPKALIDCLTRAYVCTASKSDIHMSRVLMRDQFVCQKSRQGCRLDCELLQLGHHAVIFVRFALQEHLLCSTPYQEDATSKTGKKFTMIRRHTQTRC
eukprot:79925-Amphidinium_carterae.3